MGELIEGLNDAVASEYARLREEFRSALAQSDYTLEQACSFADVSVGTVRNALRGVSAIGIDKLISLLLVLGGRVEIIRPEGAGAPPFQIVANSASLSSAKVSSISTTSSGSSRRKTAANIEAKNPSAKRKSKADQQRNTRSKPRETRKYNEEVVYLRNYIRGSRLVRLRRSA